MVLLCIAG